ncbi:MAG: hypothetical protein LKJ95_05630 [Bacteroidales bacterium]|nr:hypothetical protein [Bacteroidales bacterium]
MTDFCQSQLPAKSQCNSNLDDPGALRLPSDLHGGFATGQTSTPLPMIWWGGAAMMNEIGDYQAMKLNIEIAEKTKNHAMKFFKTEP